MAATPVYGLRYPGTGDTPHGPDQIQDLAEDVEAKFVLVDASTRGTAIARGSRDTVSTGTTTIAGAERLDDKAVIGGHLYLVVAPCVPNSTVPTDNVRIEIRYTTDGSTPTTASPILPHSQIYTGLASKTIIAPYVPGSNQTLSLLLCVARDSGTGTVSLFADGNRGTDLLIIDLFADPGDSGTDL